MAVQMQSISTILTEKFEKLKFGDFTSSIETLSPLSTPSTPSSPSFLPYEIQIIQKEDKDEVLELMRKFFISDEPLNVAIGLLDEENPRCLELEEYSTYDIDSGLNLKAVLNGKIIGICLNGIIDKGYLDDDDHEPVGKNKKFAKILSLLEHVGRESKIFEHHPDVEKCMTIRIVAVDSCCRGKGVAQNLINSASDLAKEKGCQLMAVDCSSHFTDRAVRKLGYQRIYSLKYEDYKVNGEVVFKPAHPHTAICVNTKKLV